MAIEQRAVAVPQLGEWDMFPKGIKIAQCVGAAVDAGARLVTHLFDTFIVPEMTDPGVYPVGLVDYLLVEDRVTCEIIGDGTHVHPLLVEKH